MLDMSHRFFACSLSAQRYGVLRMTSVSIAFWPEFGISPCSVAGAG
jgi:hypothetical protein